MKYFSNILVTIVILVSLFTPGYTQVAQAAPAASVQIWNPLGDGISGYVNTLAVDANNNIYVGGIFSDRGNNIAKWDGDSWSTLGTGTNNGVSDLVFDSNGNLYVGGGFGMAGNVAVHQVAKWDGSNWSALGSGLALGDGGNSPQVYALATDTNDNLYVGGEFHRAGGITTNYIAKWNGSAWSALGSGMNGLVYALAVDQSGNLYAGGDFTTAGGVSAKYLAKWDGSTWAAVGAGTGLNDRVYDLVINGSNHLYAAGEFTDADGTSVNNIAKWDGSNWSALGSGANQSVGSIILDGFQTTSCAAGVNARDRSYKINSITYNAVTFTATLNVNNNTALPMGRYHLFICKSLRDMGGTSLVADKMISFLVGGKWSALGSGTNGMVKAIAPDENNNLFVGGDFTVAGGINANHIAKWNGYAWSALGSGLNGSVESIFVDGDNVYVGGEFTTAGGKNASNVAKWDGSSWSALGSGTDDTVYALLTDENHNLYAGGYFKAAGGIVVNNIAKWDGHTWSSLKNGLHGPVYDMAIDYADRVTAAGNLNVNGQDDQAVARWNGTSWVSGELTGQAREVDSFGAYMVGYFDGYFLSVNGIYLAGADDSNGSVMAIANPGIGRNIYLGGLFTRIGKKSIKRVAIWDESTQSLSPLGGGIDDGYVDELVLDHDENLYAGGTFSKAEGKSAKNIAVWSPDPPHNYVPTLFAPTNQSQLLENRPIFDWKDTFETNAYTIQIAKDSGFTNLVVNSPITGSVFIPTADLPAGMTLYWRVRRNSPTEPRPWSATWSFTTANPPSVPTLVSPAENVLTKDYTPTLIWTRSNVPAGTTFQKYEIQIADNNTFTSPSGADVSQPATGNPRYTPTSNLTSNMKYYWRVRAYNTLGQISTWSATRSFRTAILPPVLTLPADGDVNNNPTPIFTWTATPGASSYGFQLAYDVAFSSLVVNTNTANTTFTPASPLPAGVYYWRVQAKGTNGPSNWSQVWSLTIN